MKSNEVYEELTEEQSTKKQARKMPTSQSKSTLQSMVLVHMREH